MVRPKRIMVPEKRKKRDLANEREKIRNDMFKSGFILLSDIIFKDVRKRSRYEIITKTIYYINILGIHINYLEINNEILKNFNNFIIHS